MKITDLKCQTCGGELRIESRFVKTVVCRYCNTIYLLENDSLDKVGVTKPFEPLSIFKVGALGKFEKKDLQVMGRIRLQDDEDIWDEWYILLNNQPHWVEESSDSILLLSSTPITGLVESFENIRVGQMVELDQNQVFISEKGQAKVIGVEGQFTGRIKPNDEYKYIQGSSPQAAYMVEYYDDEIKAFKGKNLNFDQLNFPDD